MQETTGDATIKVKHQHGSTQAPILSGGGEDGGRTANRYGTGNGKPGDPDKTAGGVPRPISLENIVISEIPATKAKTIGHIELPDDMK